MRESGSSSRGHDGRVRHQWAAAPEVVDMEPQPGSLAWRKVQMGKRKEEDMARAGERHRAKPSPVPPPAPPLVSTPPPAGSGGEEPGSEAWREEYKRGAEARQRREMAQETPPPPLPAVGSKEWREQYKQEAEARQRAFEREGKKEGKTVVEL